MTHDLPTEDLRISGTLPLLSPAALAAESPLDKAGADFVTRSRHAVEDIFLGRDDRLLIVVGPCSIHDPAAALEYASHLREAAARHAADLCVVMRVHVEKPRTVVGWKGLINDPGLDGSFQINHGLRLARKLMIDLARLRLPAATEFLDTMLGQYYAELVTWGVIGARTVESQVHRALASGLSMPVGFKNRTDGDVRVAIDALLSARQAHWFASVTKDGAPGDARHGGKRPLPAGAARRHARDELRLRPRAGCGGTAAGGRPAAAPDGGLQPWQQRPGSRTAAGGGRRRRRADRRGAARHLRRDVGKQSRSDGAQDYRTRPLVYGRSVTDPCLAWEKTLPVFGLLAAAVRARRVQTRHPPQPSLDSSDFAQPALTVTD